MASALARIDYVSETKGLDIIVTPNVDHLARLTEGPKNSLLHSIYRNASLCLCDSQTFKKLLIMKGNIVKQVIPGSTLTQNLFDYIINASDKVLIVGGSHKVIQKMKYKYQNLDIHHINPPMGFINDPAEVDKVVEFTKTSQANYIFLAVGSPRQEILADLLKKRTDSNGVILCIGASILFVTGEVKRAPTWIQTINCEWFYRMMMEPKRLIPRYGRNFLALAKIYTSL
jgi:N-acetylglucosaminyldiphosphoundecaprenol N-acetyl-beta-D-mannosaminyltransferase